MKTKEAIQSWLVTRLASEIGMAERDIDPNASFDSLGLSSREAITLSGDLEGWLDRKLSPTLLWEYPTIAALAEHLASGEARELPAAAPSAFPHEPVALVGIGCRFPGADGPQTFWQLLVNGVDAVAEVPADRWDTEAYYDPTPGAKGKMYTRKGGFLERIELFDAGFFGISPREAARMDPQQRLVMEVAWESLENANIAPDTLGGSPTGVFIGISANDYARLQSSDPNLIDAYAGTGNAHSLAANRLSYFLDLRGPSLAIDTACSSSLVAVHQAIQSLRAGECSLALAGGVNVILSPEINMIFSHARMMAPDGRCKTFDAGADGYVRGEGCGIVVLKRLADAQADGDRIFAVIRGSAVNHDGRSNGLTAPNGLAQQAVIRHALLNSGLTPADLGYVEAHGTGTSLGDPIEVDSIKAVLLQGRDESQPLVLGSAKTNIGHLESAAGIAGLIKTALMLHHGEIPPHLHLRELNPFIELDGTPIEIGTERRTWTAGAVPRRAGVSSFGFGGANAHVIVEEAPPEREPEKEADPERPQHVLTLSAKTAEALAALAKEYCRHLETVSEASVADVCFTANTARACLERRLAIAGTARDEFCAALAAFAQGEKPDRMIVGEVRREERPKLAFLFTGQGSQYAGMGRGLYETQPVFRDALDRCDDILRDLRERPLLSVLYPAEGEASPIDETAYTQPALFAIEYALAELWKSWGVMPDAVMGHSVGEYVAACVAGVFTLEDGLKLIAERARLMGALPAGGAMAAVLTDSETVTAALAGWEDRVSIAAANGPQNTVISGDAEALATLVKKFEEKRVTCKRLTVSHAFHSPLMEPILDEFERAARSVQFHAPRIPVVSNLTGRLVTEGDVFDACYWRTHLRRAVQFDAGIRALSEAGYALFLEAGPAPVLSGMGARCLPRGAAAWLPSLSKGKDDWSVILPSLQKLYVAGFPIDWNGFDQLYKRRRVSLPTYPFEKQRHWLDVQPVDRPRTAVVSEASVAAEVESRETVQSGGLNGHGEWLYELQWLEGSRTVSGGKQAPLCCLVFVDGSGVGDALVSRLEAGGHRCVRVMPGEAYARHDEGRATIDPEDPGDYERLCRDLAATPDRVVHLWSLDVESGEEASPTALERARTLGCQSALYIAKALYALQMEVGSKSLKDERRLWFVTRGVQPAGPRPISGSPFQAPLWGFGRSLAVEHADTWGGLLDLDGAPAADAAAFLSAEIIQPDGENQVAVREGVRYVARLRGAPHIANPNQPASPGVNGLRCRADGTYLITGGLGGLGLQVAHWLVERGATSLVLLSRTQLPPRDAWDNLQPGTTLAKRVAVIRKLEARGVNVHAVAVDVADEPQLSRFIDEYRREGFLPIRGVVHAAGVLDGQAVTELDAESLANVFRPKVTGSWLLHRAFNGGGQDALDFFVLFSSAASLMGSALLANYAAANAFMDSLAHYRRAKGQPALCINWGPWAEVGMAAEAGVVDLLARAGQKSIRPVDGLAVLECLVQTDPIQVCVMDTDWSVVGSHAQKLGRDAPALSELIEFPGTTESTSRVRQTQPFSTHPEELETYLRRELANVLYRDEETIPLDQNFTELGLDSIMLMEVLNSIERDLGLRLFPKEAFDRPTIQELASYLASEMARAKAETVHAVDPQPMGAGPVLVPRRRLRTTVPAVRNKPVVFLLSGPRSGSTLLRVMLAGHPNLFCPPELHLLQFNSMGEWHEELDKSYLGEGLQRAFMELRGLDADGAKGLIDELITQDLPVEKVYAMLQADAAPRLLVDKSPTYGSSIETLEHAERIFDGAKYIHLVRHPYATIESFMRNRFERLVAEGAADPLALGEEVWTTTNANVQDFVAPMLASKHHLIRFEDLVSDPEKTMKALCAFLEIPFDPAVLYPYEGRRMTDGVHSESAPIGDPNFLNHAEIDPALGTVWKRVRLPRRLGGYARRVATELGYSLPVEETLGTSGEPTASQTVQHVIRIQPKGDHNPFFCVAPAGGIALPYYNLPQYIGEDTPFYALQDPSLNPLQEPYGSVQELAAEHVVAIRAIQPEGPYYLGGWSFGGTVAFETAQQLMGAGHTVALLAILDSEARVASLRAKTWQERLKWTVNQIKMSVNVISYWPPYFRDAIYLLLPSAMRKHRSKKNEPSLWEYVTWAWADAIRHHMLTRADIVNVVSRNSRLMLIRQPSTRRTWRVLRANLRVVLEYVPQPYSGKITLLRSENQEFMHSLHAHPSLGWSEVADGGLEVITVPGNHAAMLLKPYIETVGATLRDCLERARAEHEPSPEA